MGPRSQTFSLNLDPSQKVCEIRGAFILDGSTLSLLKPPPTLTPLVKSWIRAWYATSVHTFNSGIDNIHIREKKV